MAGLRQSNRARRSAKGTSATTSTQRGWRTCAWRLAHGRAFKNMDFKVGPNAIVGLAGENGAGRRP
jgi:ABC-type multidrug transport system ATPase subunit